MAELIFSFTIEDYEAPFLASPSPLNGAKGIGRDSLCDIRSFSSS